MRKADRRRRRTTGTVVEIATRTERRKHRVNRPQQHRVYEYTVTQYYPVVVFSAEGRVCRLECPHTCLKHELSVGETVDILYEDDHPQRFQIDCVLQRERKNSVQEIIIGIAWIIVALIVTIALFNHAWH